MAYPVVDFTSTDGKPREFQDSTGSNPLELAEEGTRLADAAGGVPDEVWANAAKHYDEGQLAALVSQIAVINAFNRGNVITRQPAGDYRVGQFS